MIEDRAPATGPDGPLSGPIRNPREGNLDLQQDCIDPVWQVCSGAGGLRRPIRPGARAGPRR